MPEYRRSLIQGGTFFFTVVTYHRQKILTTPEARRFLRAAWINVAERYPFTTDAICLLPDHIHCIWTLPEGDANYPLRWGEIKRIFSKAYLKSLGRGENKNESHQKRGEAAIWQRRFWEHTIRDTNDYQRHVEYIHYNPVKHGWVDNVSSWQWSSFHRYVKMGFYEKGWGDNYPETSLNLNFGE